MESAGLKIGLRIWVALVLLALFAPIVLIVVYAFDPAVVETWPIKGFTLHWFSVAWNDPDVRAAFLLSLRVGLAAMGVALVLGTAVATACTTSSSSAGKESRSCWCCRSRCRA